MSDYLNGVRGVARSRGGATDTSVLIWKTVEANPGITRNEIWKLIEYAIPAGYALRLFDPRTNSLVDADSRELSVARARTLNKFLSQMLYDGRLVSGDAKFSEHRYSVGKAPSYHGDIEKVDLDGSKAADHLSLAGAIRTLQAMSARYVPNRTRGPHLCVRPHEFEALQVVIAASKNHPTN